MVAGHASESAMTELIEKDPRLERVTDPATSRNLLEDPHPLEATLPPGKSATARLRVENGPEAPVELTVSADQDWVEVRQRKLNLMGGETGECPVVIHPTGQGEFANLCFAWQGGAETYREYVLVWRKLEPPKAAQGVWPKPSWMG